jgi:hypothetical protein
MHFAVRVFVAAIGADYAATMTREPAFVGATAGTTPTGTLAKTKKA